MKKWNLIIDVEKCENCQNCFLACKDEFVGNEFKGYSTYQPKQQHRWIDILKKERGQYPLVDIAYLPLPCFHCDDAPCVKTAKDSAVYKRADGIVIIDPVKAKGQKDIARFCPYGAIRWNEDEKLAQKCTLCAHLLDENWKEPRCVSVCPTSALQVAHLEDSEMKKKVETEGLRYYKANEKTAPRVYYKNLHRFTECFLGGSVAVTVDNVTDCVREAQVTLKDSSGQLVAEEKTDVFGDFKFDHLRENSGSYNLLVSHSDYGEKQVEVELQKSLNLGVISLSQ